MNVLITGGTGFLSKHLTDYLLENTDYTIFLYARNEVKLANIRKDKRVHPICGDIRDEKALHIACKENQIKLIVHTAAYKRIDICQDHPIEAYKTNVEGTINCINVCKDLNMSLCFISTDKACEPCTTYGATKYLAEQLVRRESHKSQFEGYVIRYGNVLNSTGSVLGIWEKQFSKDGKVQVRDKEMTRFFWKVEDSAKYIHDCISQIGNKRGKVFIPELKALNIFDMACHLYDEENVIITKPDHAEKIHESLSGDFCSKDHVVHPQELL